MSKLFKLINLSWLTFSEGIRKIWTQVTKQLHENIVSDLDCDRNLLAIIWLLEVVIKIEVCI